MFALRRIERVIAAAHHADEARGGGVLRLLRRVVGYRVHLFGGEIFRRKYNGARREIAFAILSGVLKIETFIVGPMPNNLYLVIDDEAREVVVIDPSLGSDAARQRVRELQQNGFKLVGAWNTHGHFDHVHDNALWHAEFAMPLLMHSADNYFLEHLREQSLWLGFPAPDLVMPSGELEDGQELRIGNHVVRVLATPGHSPGSVSFLFEDFPGDPLCVSGDVLFHGSAGRTDLPLCSREELDESLRLLLQLPPQTRILSGHGDATTIGEEMRNNPFCRAALRKTA